jgi:DEAD/DEAH box helicase domain-containing protein
MGKNIIVFDIETKNSFLDVGGRENFTKLEISVLGSYDYRTAEFKVYEEKELSEFAQRLQQKPLLVGFNSRRFDVPILQKYIPFGLQALPQLDIMEEFVKILGHRVSLESVATATLGKGKSGSGLEAIAYWREGRLEELKKYCLDDVKITKEIYEFGAIQKELFYTSKFGRGKARVDIGWRIENPNERDNNVPVQGSLF